jgi:hypothetical protein
MCNRPIICRKRSKKSSSIRVISRCLKSKKVDPRKIVVPVRNVAANRRRTPLSYLLRQTKQVTFMRR